jgi:diaminopropionate ammonia-lyase
MQAIQWIGNPAAGAEVPGSAALMAPGEIEQVRSFHRGFPQYRPTSLHSLKTLAKHLGLGGLYVKDESSRFGLNAFKVLGSSFAMGKFIAGRLHRDINRLDYETFVSDEVKKELGDITFYTATDGNHGRGVAWAAAKMRQKSVVLMPKGTSQARYQNIVREGADARIVDMNYDDAVRLARDMAQNDAQGELVQDTAWEGYRDIPSWIMQGYGTMALETVEQLRAAGIERPTHVFVQAGVGSLAGAVQAFFAHLYGSDCPITTVVEASAADCFYQSIKGQKLTAVSGRHPTIMCGLACGEANILAWDILKNLSSFFVSVPDWAAAKGMRVLAAPLPGDPGIISGESGAVSIGVLMETLEQDSYADFRKALRLDEHSIVLVFSTEGNTDPEKYRDIVWNGASG